MAADSGRLREACGSRAHWKQAGHIRYKLSRGEEGFWTVFGTVTLPAGASVAYRRGEGVIYRVFGTATLPTGRSVAFSRSHCELVYRIVAILGFVKFTWDEPLLIIK